jgi:hypothetical protein
MVVMVDVKVASADRDSFDLNQDFVVLHLWFRNVPNLDQPFPFPYFTTAFILASFLLRLGLSS